MRIGEVVSGDRREVRGTENSAFIRINCIIDVVLLLDVHLNLHDDIKTLGKI